jgi:hypothetical protein
MLLKAGRVIDLLQEFGIKGNGSFITFRVIRPINFIHGIDAAA